MPSKAALSPARTRCTSSASRSWVKTGGSAGVGRRWIPAGLHCLRGSDSRRELQPRPGSRASQGTKVETESMGSSITPVVALFFVGMLMLIVFAFVSVMVWTEARRKEREALYRNELLKKLADTPGPGAEAVLQSLKDEEQRKHARRREHMTLGGSLCLALGLAGLLGLYVMRETATKEAWGLCFVPILLGAALVGHARLVMAR